MHIKRLFLLLSSSLILSSTGCVYRSYFPVLGELGLWGEAAPEDTPRGLDYSAKEDLGSTELSELEDNTLVQLPPPPLEITPEVEAELDHFTQTDRRFIPLSLERREEFLPILKRIFLEEGVPYELLNVAIIESMFDPDAKSRSGAVGLWQFTKSTGELYGLRVGRFVDDRRDPELSTRAAARHLRDLYDAYQDWYLALAAYNAGSNGLDRAITKAGSRDFWEISRSKSIREQTRRYVAKFIAVTFLIENGRYTT